jgi:branched-chain amino acid transport system ATP-binding protein
MLELRQVHAGYGDTTVLRDVTLVVPPGRVVALLGANGAGKTTVLRTVCGLLRPSAGQVRFAGQDVSGWAPHRLVASGICHIPEGRGVFPQLTVRENLALQARVGPTEDAVNVAVEAFPALRSRLSDRAGSLSGGQQQMLALSRAFVSEPKLVLLDEVSMGLAPRIIDEIFEALGRLVEKGTALLLVEQYVSRALGLADYVFVLSRGRVSFCGEPSEIAGDDVFDHYLAAQPG